MGGERPQGDRKSKPKHLRRVEEELIDDLGVLQKQLIAAHKRTHTAPEVPDFQDPNSNVW